MFKISSFWFEMRKDPSFVGMTNQWNRQ